jgi:hypothetical protein
MNSQINPQLQPIRPPPRHGFGGATTLQQCDVFVIVLDTSGGGVIDTTSFGLVAPNFINVSYFGDSVGGTYMGASPYTVPTNFSYTKSVQVPTQTQGLQWVNQTYNFPVVSVNVTGKSTSGVCAPTPTPIFSVQNPGNPTTSAPVLAVQNPGRAPIGAPAPISSATTSDNTPYYVAGGVAAVSVAAFAWWKWGRK